MTYQRPLYAVLASTLQARATCLRTDNTEWFDKHTAMLDSLVIDFMPRGSGIDSGTTFDIEASTSDKLVFRTAFHHMNDGGYYDGWTEHRVIVRPSLAHSITLTVSGRNRNEIKDYLADCFRAALTAPLENDNEAGYSRP